MEARAQIPVTLPHPMPTTSYWQDPPDPELADYLSSDSLPGHDEVVDTIIIGSGISGARIAWGLLEKEDGKTGDGGKKKRIVMLEARQACSGASGRNGGHTKAASYRSFPSNLSSLGSTEAIKIARLEYKNILATHAFAAAHSIQCESRLCDTVDIIYDDAQWESCLEAVALIQKHFTDPRDQDGIAKYELWTPAQARSKFLAQGTSISGETVKGAVSYLAGSISAYLFVIGVLKLCLERGLELYTNTPVLALSQANGIWDVKTGRGVVRAKRVVVGVNAYTSFLLPSFQGSIVPLRGQVTAQRPGSKMPGGLVRSEGLATTYSFIYKNGYEYMIPRPKGSPYPGDIIIGGGLVHAPNEGLEEYGTTDDSSTNSIINKYLKETLVSYFGENWGEDAAGGVDGEGRVRKEWTGIMGYTPDGYPFIGRVPGEEGLFISAGFLGHGMVMCWECGGEVVRMIEGMEGDGGFPEAFLVNEERMGKRFLGRLHTGAVEGDGDGK